jgi:hypothetical protein
MKLAEVYHVTPKELEMDGISPAYQGRKYATSHYRKRERRALGLQPKDEWPFLSRGWEDGLGQHA